MGNESEEVTKRTCDAVVGLDLEVGPGAVVPRSVSKDTGKSNSER